MAPQVPIAQTVPAEHKDLIHDVALDYYGRRMATCSSDQSVKIWDLQEDGSWKTVANWKTHSGSVWKVTWGNPLFGQLIATCSFDRTAALWEETVGDGGSVAHSHWVKRATFVDCRGSVTDVQFAPKHLGLQLATTSADGQIRVYENIDQSNLSQWQTLTEFPCKFATNLSCLTWSQSRHHQTLLAAGSDDEPNGGARVVLYELQDGGRRLVKADTLSMVTEPVHDITFANTLGRSFHTLAVASTNLYIFQITPITRSMSVSSASGATSTNAPRSFEYDTRLLAQCTEHSSRVWRVSWNITGTILASSGDDGFIRLWRSHYSGDWKNVATIRGDGTLAENDGVSSSDFFTRKPSVQDSLSVPNGVKMFPALHANVASTANWGSNKG